MKKQHCYFFIVLILLLVGCAKRGTITGGLKDTIAPVLKVSLPKNFSTNFTGQSVKLTFDEYVKLKDIGKQLVVSPPMSKKPQVLPLTASKTININFLEPLQPNTTYSLNFGKSIEDNNEGNPYPQFKYVFSTGSYIDSLAISGYIKDALNKKPDAAVSIMLYEIDEKYNDSLIYKENPRYVTSTLDTSANFKIENIKAGKYRLIALKDNNSNYRFDPKTEKIGFYNDIISIPNDTSFEIKLFQEEEKFKAFKPAQASGNSAFLGYEGNPKDVKLTLKKGSETIKTVITKYPKKDSLQIWFKPFKLEKLVVDSLQLSVNKNQYDQTFTFKIKNQKIDTLRITSLQSKFLDLSETFTLNTSIPFTAIDASKMKLVNKDSVAVPFTAVYDEMNLALKVDFKKEPLERYTFKLLPEAITDLFEKKNEKPIVFTFETKNTSDYGNLRLNLENVKQFPVIVELTDKNGAVQVSYYSENKTEIDFNLIKPNLYTLRLIYDDNKNGVWDSGNFLEKRQSEEVIYFPKDIDIRANWDVQQTFILKK